MTSNDANSNALAKWVLPGSPGLKEGTKMDLQREISQIDCRVIVTDCLWVIAGYQQNCCLFRVVCRWFAGFLAQIPQLNSFLMGHGQGP